jgi:sulfofructose kinase
MLLAIGHISWDILAPVPSFPTEDAKMEIPAVLESGGGPAATAACVAGAWGVPSVLAGVIGHDVYAQRVVDELSQWRVNTSLIEIRTGHCTPLSFIMVNETNGSRTIINRKAAAAPLPITAESWRQRLPQAPAVILCDGHEIDASLAALDAFPGVPSVLDGGAWRPRIDLLGNRVSHLAVSAKFAQQATGMDPRQRNRTESCLDNLRKRFPSPQFVAITLGDRGVVWDDGRPHSRGAMPVKEVIDTTGAGDIWHGAMACALAWGWPLNHAIAVAHAAAGLSVTRPGGRASIPSRDEALAMATQILTPPTYAMTAPQVTGTH